MKLTRGVVVGVAAGIGLASASLLIAQEAQPESPASQQQLSLTLPENLELSALVDLVSAQLGINVLYDDQLRGRPVTLRIAKPVPRDSLLPLLRSTLEMKGFVLVGDERTGWLRVAATQNLASVAAPAAADALSAIEQPAQTRVFELKHAAPKRAEELVRPFLSQPGGNTQAIDEHRMLVVTDLATNLPRVERIIELTDRPPEEVAVRFVPVTHLEAAQLARQVTELMTAKARVVGSAAADGAGIEAASDERTNQVVLIGEPGKVSSALELAASLDVPLGLVTEVYQFRSASPERIDRLAKGLMDPVLATRLYRSSIDAEAGVLVVTSTPEVQEQVGRLQAALDVPMQEDQSPIRFYKLANAKAVEVLEIVRSLGGETPLESVSVDSAPTNTSAESTRTVPLGVDPSRLTNPGAAPDSALARSGLDLSALQPVRQAIRDQQATVTADPNTNSIIVVGEPGVQRVFEHMIQTLDRRRPQVLVEVTLVAVDTSDGYSVGVELSRGDSSGDATILNFSSFGLSQINRDTGALRIRPGTGFNGTIIGSEIADVVVQALATDRRSRIVSAPKILVNDNATGTLESVNEQPFISTNASDTVATTSFGGFVDAGTTITVTPHISEGDHLVLEYEVTLNSFTGEGTRGVPPPRNTNALTSSVTVPDGDTIVVGGLTRSDSTFSKQSIPILGEIPLLEYLFSSRSVTGGESTLFAFIRPVILRDDRFEDLRYLSGVERDRAELSDGFPESEPLLVY